MAVSFAQQMREYAKRTNRTLEQVTVDSVISIGSTIILNTPVGDPSLWQSPPPPGYKPGTLRNSWFTTLWSPFSGGVRPQGTGGRDSFANLVDVAQKSPGKVTYFINPAPYARRIEFGHSTQAPTGMVRNAVAEFPAIVRRAVGANK